MGGEVPSNNNFTETIDVPTINFIPEGRRYWFVRTFGGALFDYYYDTGKVGILGNAVPVEYIKNAPHNAATFSTLQGYIHENMYPENTGEATKLANQLVDFYHNMKVDDIVLMPSANSDYIAFGLVTSGYKEKEQVRSDTFVHRDKELPYPTKTREVKWLKIMRKHEVVGDLRNLLISQMGLTKADNYADFIESNLSTFFVKDDTYYSTLCIDLNEEEELNAFDLYRYLEALTMLYEDYCYRNNIPYNEALFLKIKVQSPGNFIWKIVEETSKKAGDIGKKIIKGAGAASFIGLSGLIVLSVTGSDPNIELTKNQDGSYDFKAGIKGNIWENFQNAKDQEQVRSTKHKHDSLDIEDRKFEQYLKRKAHGALTEEDRKKYESQLVDSAKALNITTVESKAVSKKEVED